MDFVVKEEMLTIFLSREINNQICVLETCREEPKEGEAIGRKTF